MTSTCQLSRNGSSKTLEEPFVKVEILRRDCPSRSPHFNPLRPCGRRRKPSFCPLAIERFQSTPPVWAETNHTRSPPQLSCISIHSARVGGDELSDTICPVADGFQSTPPVWAETLVGYKTLRRRGHFNPLRPCGRRPTGMLLHRMQWDFNPLRPCGRRLLSLSLQMFIN